MEKYWLSNTNSDNSKLFFLFSLSHIFPSLFLSFLLVISTRLEEKLEFYYEIVFLRMSLMCVCICYWFHRCFLLSMLLVCRPLPKKYIYPEFLLTYIPGIINSHEHWKHKWNIEKIDDNYRRIYVLLMFTVLLLLFFAFLFDKLLAQLLCSVLMLFPVLLLLCYKWKIHREQLHHNNQPKRRNKGGEKRQQHVMEIDR